MLKAYDKFVGFYEQLSNLGTCIKKTQECYDDSIKREKHILPFNTPSCVHSAHDIQFFSATFVNTPFFEQS